MNCLFRKLLETSVPIINAQLMNGTLKPHFSVFTIRTNSFHGSSNSYFRPDLIRLKQDGETKSGKNYKALKFGNKIEQHDFQSKLNNIVKWLKKGHRVKVVIQNFNDKGRTDNLFDMLTRELDGKGILEEKMINQKDMRFTISPTAEITVNEDTKL